jgi:PmbA protein
MKTEITSHKDIEAISQWVLDECLRGGASGADVLYSEGEGSALSLKDGEVEECTTGFSAGMGVRTIMSDGRQGIAYGNRLDDKTAMKDIIAWSLSNCKKSEPEEGISLYSGKLEPDPSIMLEDERIAQITPDERMSLCKKMTELARSADKRIVSVRAAAWQDGWGASFYATTTGLSGWDRGSSANCEVMVLAQDGMYTEMGGYGIESRRYDELDIEKTSARAASDTVAALGGRPMKTGAYTAVIEPETAASLIDIIGDLFCASEIQKNHSMMKGKLGTAVASSCLTLTDDGRIPWKAGTSAWDSEGVPTRRVVLIDHGTAQSYLYNLQYAYRDGVESTGSACRGVSTLPDVGTSNLVVSPGSESAEGLRRSVKKGLYITEFMGLHTIDPVSGDFSIGAKGLLIENGEFTRPVSGVTIASNLLDFIKNISAVGADVQFFGSVATPTLVVENIVIAGE